MPNLVSWGSIELLHNLVTTLTHLHALGQPLPAVQYRAKVKLHGTNCAVQNTPEGVFAQSRAALLTPSDDRKGFAKWVDAHASYFRDLQQDCTVFGEWCGPGVEKGMAVSQLPSKIFAVFALQVGAEIIWNPDQILGILSAGISGGAGTPDNLVVMPWEDVDRYNYYIDFSSREYLDREAARVNEHVARVEQEDPFIKQRFGVSGLGEGLVLYPVMVNGHPPKSDPESYLRLMWKAKGEKHRTAGTKVAAQVDPSVVASAEEFATLMVTEARCLQGVQEVCGGQRDPKLTGKFLAWVTADVQKESRDELAASGLAWSQVQGTVQAQARTWFLRREAP